VKNRLFGIAKVPVSHDETASLRNMSGAIHHENRPFAVSKNQFFYQIAAT